MKIKWEAAYKAPGKSKAEHSRSFHAALLFHIKHRVLLVTGGTCICSLSPRQVLLTLLTYITFQSELTAFGPVRSSLLLMAME